jgi:hypothetical protein
MDPLGFAFEHYDALGVYRSNEGGKTIDDSGDVNSHAGVQHFVGPRELAAVLRAMPEVTDCVARQIYRYATGHLEAADEVPVVAGVVTRAQTAGNTFVDYLTATVSSDGFRYAGGTP